MNESQCIRVLDIVALIEALTPWWSLVFGCVGVFSVVHWLLDQGNGIAYRFLPRHFKNVCSRYWRRYS